MDWQFTHSVSRVSSGGTEMLIINPSSAPVVVHKDVQVGTLQPIFQVCGTVKSATGQGPKDMRQLMFLSNVCWKMWIHELFLVTCLKLRSYLRNSRT